jgi:hypothetical protein
MEWPQRLKAQKGYQRATEVVVEIDHTIQSYSTTRYSFIIVLLLFSFCVFSLPFRSYHWYSSSV